MTGTSTLSGLAGTPVRSRKTIINVTTPPKWKVKKQKLAEKAAREAELWQSAGAVHLSNRPMRLNTLGSPSVAGIIDTYALPAAYPGRKPLKTWRAEYPARIKNCAGR